MSINRPGAAWRSSSRPWPAPAPRHVIRTRVMLTDITTWREAARAHGEVFGEARPACTFVQVAGFIDPDWLVELEADAVVD